MSDIIEPIEGASFVPPEAPPPEDPPGVADDAPVSDSEAQAPPVDNEAVPQTLDTVELSPLAQDPAVGETPSGVPPAPDSSGSPDAPSPGTSRPGEYQVPGTDIYVGYDPATVNLTGPWNDLTLHGLQDASTQSTRPGESDERASFLGQSLPPYLVPELECHTAYGPSVGVGPGRVGLEFRDDGVATVYADAMPIPGVVLGGQADSSGDAHGFIGVGATGGLGELDGELKAAYMVGRDPQGPYAGGTVSGTAGDFSASCDLKFRPHGPDQPRDRRLNVPGGRLRINTGE